MSGAQDSLLYSRVETVLASEIADGDLRVGDQLPTEDSLISPFRRTSIQCQASAAIWQNNL